MKIHGLQKMTLLDFPGLVACTVFLGGCDMRCPFCHNSELLDMNAPAAMDENNLLKFLEGRRGLLDGVAITGGEPLLRRDIRELIISIREMGFKIKLDTNGNHPDRLISLVEEKLLDYVAVDIKNSKEKYGETIGLPGFDISRIEESVEFLLSKKVDFEFRTTVMKPYHDEMSFKGIAEWIKGADKYYLQEFVPRDTVPDQNLVAYSKEEMRQFAQIVQPYVGLAEVRGV